MSPRRGANILLVDDRPENLLALTEVLEPLGHNVITASSGEEALRVLLTDAVAVILLDVQMPGMDGFETATHIKQREKTRDIPILFLTAISREPHHQLHGYSVGAVDYLAKPFDPWILRSKVSILVDLYEKTQLLAEQAEELQRSNQELEHFAYVASHDLQEPLYVMSSFLEILSEPGGLENEKAPDYIRRASDAAARMTTLVRDLLAYARVGSGSEPPAPVDLGAAVRGALTNLETTIDANHAKVRVDELPTVRGYRGLLEQLFQNLVGNAIKFRRDDPPEVHVSAERDGAEWVVCVKDNGIGFDMDDAERVFTMFQRLHSADEYAGTGIGLALCKRIVERHGGRIWARSDRGGGTQLQFTLPVVDAPLPAASTS